MDFHEKLSERAAVTLITYKVKWSSWESSTHFFPIFLEATCPQFSQTTQAFEVSAKMGRCHIWLGIPLGKASYVDKPQINEAWIYTLPMGRL